MHKLILLPAVLLSACVSMGGPIDRAVSDSVQPGVTTKAELIQRVGRPPDKIERMSDGMQTLRWTYEHAQANSKSYVPLVGQFIGDVKTSQITFQAIVDKDGLVQEALYHQSSTADASDPPPVERPSS